MWEHSFFLVYKNYFVQLDRSLLFTVFHIERESFEKALKKR
jgi:hypothetical protein